MRACTKRVSAQRPSPFERRVLAARRRRGRLAAVRRGRTSTPCARWDGTTVLPRAAGLPPLSLSASLRTAVGTRSAGGERDHTGAGSFRNKVGGVVARGGGRWRQPGHGRRQRKPKSIFHGPSSALQGQRVRQRGGAQAGACVQAGLKCRRRRLDDHMQLNAQHAELSQGRPRDAVGRGRGGARLQQNSCRAFRTYKDAVDRQLVHWPRTRTKRACRRR